MAGTATPANALRDACDIRLGFPHDDAGSPGDWLRDVAAYLDTQKVDDEIFMSGKLARNLEDHCAELLGKQAAVWFPTGTMAQLAAALIHAAAKGKRTIGLHPTSHLLLHEEDAIRALAGLEPVTVGEWARIIEPSDVEAAADLAALFIELPHRHTGGQCPDWDTLSATISAARQKGAATHLDGARLWSVRKAMGGRSYAEICAPFDTVYVSFYKDVGALGGAILAGSEDLMAQAKTWRHRQGGLQVRSWPVMADVLRRLPAAIESMPDCISAAGEIAGLFYNAGFEIEPFPVQTNIFHVRVPFSEDDFISHRDAIAAETRVWLGGAGWALDGRAGRSLEVTVSSRLASADRNRLDSAIRMLAGRRG
ncbi:threonine aldolase family protein [Hyphobacterium sp.]|jgi:threonine aldolase|uniref:threonine aldolase family protein n=1 Tax=Hyphobacterium sp. TaxID=2004662 RepID=UPI003BAA82DE